MAVNQETDPNYNREGGIAIIPGSNYANEMQKWEQIPGKYGSNPGNPYRYRPFPKMVYRAEMYRGKVCCMAAPPDPYEFARPEDLTRAQESARQFTEKCQLIVKDERELQRALENNYRESPEAAVECLLGKAQAASEGAAVRRYEDRNMSEKAQAEAKAAEREHFDETGLQLPAVPEKPRRGRPRKVA